MRKLASTNAINKQHLEENCGIAYTAGVLSGRWKVSILAFLMREPALRYSALRDRLPGVSQRMLSAQLRELEADGLIERRVYPEVPPRVEYYLTSKGRALENVLTKMSEWGERYKVAEMASTE